jgi:hypothetical protein
MLVNLECSTLCQMTLGKIRTVSDMKELKHLPISFLQMLLGDTFSKIHE